MIWIEILAAVLCCVSIASCVLTAALYIWVNRKTRLSSANAGQKSFHALTFVSLWFALIASSLNGIVQAVFGTAAFAQQFTRLFSQVLMTTISLNLTTLTIYRLVKLSLRRTALGRLAKPLWATTLHRALAILSTWVGPLLASSIYQALFCTEASAKRRCLVQLDAPRLLLALNLATHTVNFVVQLCASAVTIRHLNRKQRRIGMSVATLSSVASSLVQASRFAGSTTTRPPDHSQHQLRAQLSYSVGYLIVCSSYLFVGIFESLALDNQALLLPSIVTQSLYTVASCLVFALSSPRLLGKLQQLVVSQAAEPSISSTNQMDKSTPTLSNFPVNGDEVSLGRPSISGSQLSDLSRLSPRLRFELEQVSKPSAHKLEAWREKRLRFHKRLTANNSMSTIASVSTSEAGRQKAPTEPRAAVCDGSLFHRRASKNRPGKHDVPKIQLQHVEADVHQSREEDAF